jgi:hypothetical protein
MAILWVATVVQLFAPSGDISYVLENAEIVEATGTLSTTWYVGGIIFYFGLLVAAAGFLMYTVSGNGVRATDA